MYFKFGAVASSKIAVIDFVILISNSFIFIVAFTSQIHTYFD
jgi:hypothetical protein